MKNLRDTRAYKSLRDVMIHWGFGDTESAIYALLALHGREMTAKEIAEHVGRAYSSVVNELNKLIRHGLVERTKREKCYHYRAVIDVIQILRRERRKVLNHLREARESLKEIDGDKYRELIKHLEEAIEYLGELDKEA